MNLKSGIRELIEYDKNDCPKEYDLSKPLLGDAGSNLIVFVRVKKMYIINVDKMQTVQ